MTRATKKQSVILSIMRERRPSDPTDHPGQPANIYRNPSQVIKFTKQHGETLDQWLWINPGIAKTMKKHGWIEWHAGSPGKRTGYYITDAGREVLLT